MKADDDRVAAILRELGLTEWEGLSEEFQRSYLAVFREGGEKALRSLARTGPEFFGAINSEAIAFAEKRAAELVTGVTASTREGLRALIERAFTEGLTPGDLAGEILDSHLFSKARAGMIARTELAFAHVEGTLIGWKESGVVKGKRWLLANTHPEEDICDEAAAMGVVPLDSDFGGTGDPPAHPHCLCDVLAELAEEG